MTTPPQQKRAMAPTIALEEIIACSVFRFHGNGFIFRFHGLRHTNASVMLSLGIVDKVAMARGGWSTDITMKQIYQHVFQRDKDIAGGKVDLFFQAIADGKPFSAHEIAHEE